MITFNHLSDRTKYRFFWTCKTYKKDMFSKVFEFANYDYVYFGALPALLTAHIINPVNFCWFFFLHKIDDRSVPNKVFGVADFKFLCFRKLLIFVFDSGLHILPGPPTKKNILWIKNLKNNWTEVSLVEKLIFFIILYCFVFLGPLFDKMIQKFFLI